MPKYLILNRDGAGVGEVEALNADQAIIEALNTFNFNDLDHAHERYMDEKNCIWRRAIREKQSKEVKH